MELKLAFIGFGNVGRAFARLLASRESLLASQYELSCSATAIATASHGCVLAADGIDLLKASRIVEQGRALTDLAGCTNFPDPASVVEHCDADVLLEISPLNPVDGEPAISHIRTALLRSINVVTANKGPIAFAYRQLSSLAKKQNVSFRFEGTVMDGAPVFNLVESCLPAARILGFSGVLNSTTNLIITGMEEGRSFEESLEQARRAGIAEANSDYDIDGWDAAAKAVALANVLMNTDLRPSDVERIGIRDIDPDAVAGARSRGETIRLVARAKTLNGITKIRVSPESLPLSSELASVRGTSNVLTLNTDLMAEIAIYEKDPGVEQTAYALLSDLCAVGARMKPSGQKSESVNR